MEYYFQWQLTQYSDSLYAGPYVVCVVAEARDVPSIQNVSPAVGPMCSPVQWMLWIFPHNEAADA
jgi:hypothetical protein